MKKYPRPKKINRPPKWDAHRVYARRHSTMDKKAGTIVRSPAWKTVVSRLVDKEDRATARDTLDQIMRLLVCYESLDTSEIKHAKSDRREAGKIIREAAKSIERYQAEMIMANLPEGFDLPQELRRIAARIRGGLTYHEMINVSAENISKRGGVKNKKAGERRGLLIRELDKLVPSSIKDRYAIIANLMRKAGIKNTSRALVRSILLKGHT